jgi:dTDP-4-dehydrorhamnose 3,5-epimerase
MEVIPLAIPDVWLIKPQIHRDHRGFFLEAFQHFAYNNRSITYRFIQDNHSRSKQHVIRGLHFQTQPGQTKLVRVARGCIFDVVVDLRRHSPTRGKWCGVFLSDMEHYQLLIPKGFAHGFCVMSEEADVIYKVDELYCASTETTLAYDDSTLNITWPVSNPILSERDREGHSWADILDMNIADNMSGTLND